ncbi:mycofactocin oligosaccharide methyltransferase MftM [Gordonia iterans]
MNEIDATHRPVRQILAGPGGSSGAAHPSARGPLPLRVRSGANRVKIEHRLSPAQISDDRIVSALGQLMEAGLLVGQNEFERAFVAVVESCGVPAETAWRWFYRNSVAELRSGQASFSPVHLRARSLLVGDEVLEVGSCFGFFALQCAQDGYRVAATDIEPAALRLLDAAAREFGLDITTQVGDARDLPFPALSVDTVTLLHLLEHLDSSDVHRAISEALCVARRRVIIAVPYEETPSEHFGHRQCLTEHDLRDWAAPWSSSHRIDVFDDHGGWLILDRR